MKFDIQLLKPIFLSLVLLSLAAYGFFNYMYIPLCQKSKVLDEEIVKKERELDEIKKIVCNLDAKKVEFEKVKRELEYIIRRLPTKEEIPELLKTITELAIKSDVELVSFRPNPSVSKEVYEEVPVSLLIKGTYHKIGLFLTKVGNLERIATPSNVRLSAVTPTEKDPTTARADLVITAFIYKEH